MSKRVILLEQLNMLKQDEYGLFSKKKFKKGDLMFKINLGNVICLEAIKENQVQWDHIYSQIKSDVI